MSQDKAEVSKDDYCSRISSLVKEALIADIHADKLSEAVVFPFGFKNWPGKEHACFAALEMARSSLEIVMAYIQADIQRNQGTKTRR